MSDIYLLIGRGERSIGETRSSTRAPSVRRSVTFRGCTVDDSRRSEGEEPEIEGRKLSEFPLTVTVNEQSPDEAASSGQMGEISQSSRYGEVPVDLYVSSVAFQQFWEMAEPFWGMADVPMIEQSLMRIGAVPGRTANDVLGFVISHMSLDVRRRRHPVMVEFEQLRQRLDQRMSILLWLLGALVLIELVRLVNLR